MTELNLAIKARGLLLLPILIVKRVASLTFSQVDPWYLSMNSSDNTWKDVVELGRILWNHVYAKLAKLVGKTLHINASLVVWIIMRW